MGASLLVFILCMSVGAWRASRAPLVPDEYSTLCYGVYLPSYGDIFAGRIRETVINPLFYVTQKIFLDVSHYPNLNSYCMENNIPQDYQTLIFFRITPLFFMSLAMTFIFYYFTRYYSLTAGIYSVVLSAFTFTIGYYSTIVRLYALWVFLTTLQVLYFLRCAVSVSVCCEKCRAWHVPAACSPSTTRMHDPTWSSLVPLLLLFAYPCVFAGREC